MAPPSAPSESSADFRDTLWKVADKLRNNLDAAEYKPVVLGLIFLKYISDSFEDHRLLLGIERENPRLKNLLNKEYGRERMQQLTGELRDQFVEPDRLQRAIRENLRSLGYEI